MRNPDFSLLKTLSPAECLILLKAEYADMKKVLALTLVDLVMKEALEYRKVETEKVRAGAKRVFRHDYIFPGKKYDQYKAREYEEIFLEPFQMESRVMLRHLVILAYDFILVGDKFIRMVRRSPGFEGFTRRGLEHMVGGGFELTEKGLETRTRLLDTIESMGKYLKSGGKESAKKLIGEIGANIFFMPGFSIPLLRLVEREVQMEINREDFRASLYPGWDDE